MGTTRSLGPRRPRTYWVRWTEEYARSGMSVTAFCAKHTLPVKTFSRWRRRLAEEAERETAPGFIELPSDASSSSSTAASPVSGWELELELPEGVRLRLRRC